MLEPNSRRIEPGGAFDGPVFYFNTGGFGIFETGHDREIRDNASWAYYQTFFKTGSYERAAMARYDAIFAAERRVPDEHIQHISGIKVAGIFQEKNKNY